MFTVLASVVVLTTLLSPIEFHPPATIPSGPWIVVREQRTTNYTICSEVVQYHQAPPFSGAIAVIVALAA